MALDAETAASGLIRKVQKALGKGSQAALLAPLLYARDGLSGLESLPADWRTYPAPSTLATVGERWSRDVKALVLSVPSVVIPHERNFIVNPSHQAFATIEVGPPEPFSFDPRMWKRKG